jgi:hypothetical protein
MTKSELIDYASENGIDVDGRMTKAAIIDTIEADNND